MNTLLFNTINNSRLKNNQRKLKIFNNIYIYININYKTKYGDPHLSDSSEEQKIIKEPFLPNIVGNLPNSDKNIQQANR